MAAEKINISNEATIPVGCDYTDDEREFLMAVQRYKEINSRPFPTWREILAITRSLGYRKTEQPTELPVPDKRHGSRR